MKIEFGINPNCSECVMQICGVTKFNVEELKQGLREALGHKYNPEFLNKWLDSLLKIEGKFCLHLYEYAGADNIDDWEALCKVAKEIGIPIDMTSTCSSPIDTDDQMQSHMKENDWWVGND